MSVSKEKVKHLTALLVTISGLVFVFPTYSMTVYRQLPTQISSASLINSNGVTNANGSDQDVTAYDNFTLHKAASITSVAWRGASSNKSLVGFTIKIYTSQANSAAQPEIANPLATIDIIGKAGEKSLSSNLSDYHAFFSEPLPLKAGVQYWISIVSNRKDVSPWGWANGTGGDEKSVQSYSEFKVLPALGDRAFSINDSRAHSGRR